MARARAWQIKLRSQVEESTWFCAEYAFTKQADARRLIGELLPASGEIMKQSIPPPPPPPPPPRPRPRAQDTRPDTPDDTPQTDFGPPIFVPPEDVLGEDLNEYTFGSRCIEDLDGSQGQVFIQAVFVRGYAIERVAAALQRCVARGVQVCVFVQRPRGLRADGTIVEDSIELRRFLADVALLRSLGVHVILREEIHMKVVVIDRKIAYRGSLNPLSYKVKGQPKGDKWKNEGMTRWVSPAIAAASIEEFHLDRCPRCAAKRKQRPTEEEVFLTPKNLGKLITQRRKYLGLSQEEFARLIGISRARLSYIERGSRVPGFDVVVKMWRVLGRAVAICPYYAETMIEHMNRRDCEMDNHNAKTEKLMRMKKEQQKRRRRQRALERTAQAPPTVPGSGEATTDGG